MSQWNKKDELCRLSALRFLPVIQRVEEFNPQPPRFQREICAALISTCFIAQTVYLPLYSHWVCFSHTVFSCCRSFVLRYCWRHVRRAGPCLVGHVPKVSRKLLKSTDREETASCCFDSMHTGEANMSNTLALKEQHIIDLFSWFN